jgi:hypothetical protein
MICRSASRNSLAGWRLSALRGTAPSPETVAAAQGTVHPVSGTLTPVPGTLTPAPEKTPPVPGTNATTIGRSPHTTLQQPAGTTNAKKPGHRTVPSPPPTASRETNTVDVSGGDVCATATGRIFITDKSTKQRFLIDTGSDLCVFPASSFHSAGSGSTTTSARLTALPSAHTDGCTSALTWD